jgi:copper transport protein
MLAAVGAVVFHLAVLRRLPASTRGCIPFLESQVARVGVWASLVLAAVAVPRLLLQAQAFTDAGDPVWPMAVKVLGTTWGRAWMLQAAGTIVALAGFVLAWRVYRVGWKLALGALIMVALAAACMGHPIASPRLPWAAVAGDVIHLASVGAWVGSLFILARIGFSADIRSEGGGTMASLLAAFHDVALWSAGIAVATGVFSVLIRIAHLSALLRSMYGTVLFVKIGVVAVVLTFGAYNSRSAVRRAQNGQVRSVMLSLVAELLFVVVTVAVTAALVGTDPPG